jgi:hypothetical protein
MNVPSNWLLTYAVYYFSLYLVRRYCMGLRSMGGQSDKKCGPISQQEIGEREIRASLLVCFTHLHAPR